jgi:RNA-directed DNA polymerase
LDQWAQQWRRRSARGEVYFVRYADDGVACFQYRGEGRRFWRELAERLEQFGLKLHPQKTRLIEFGRFASSNRKARGEGKPESFDFLGFTHVCARRRSDGRFTVRRLTIAKRQRKKLKEIRAWLKRNRAIPVADQGRYVGSVIRGAIQYFGVPGNSAALCAFRTEICKSWLRALRRRSQKAAKLTWDRFNQLVRQWVPSIRLVHPYPNERLHV